MAENAPQPHPSSEQNLPSEEGAQQDTPQPKSFFRRIWHYAYRKFPSVVPDPKYREMLAVYRRRDAEKNIQTEPPDDEAIDLRCVWAVEFYTPSHIEKLLSGFTALGWDEDHDSVRGENPALWVKG